MIRMRRPSAAAATLTGLLLGAIATPAVAAMDRPFPLVTVTGEGSVTAKPDTAHALAGVASEAKTPREATEANAKAMTAVLAALREAGIADADIGTARFSIAPVHAQRDRAEPRIVAYRVTNQVDVTVRKIAQVGEVLDKLVAAGATDIAGVTFTLSDPAKLLDQARAAAFADARRKAELFAKAAGAQVGRAVNISEDETARPQPFRMLSQAAPRAGAAATPIEPGEETLRAQVVVSFELNQ